MNRLFKARVIVKICDMKRVYDERGTPRFVLEKEHYEFISGKELQKQIDEQEGKFPIVQVNEAPKGQIQFGVFYVHKCGNRVWLFNLKEE